jgi:hypothetical protein
MAMKFEIKGLPKNLAPGLYNTRLLDAAFEQSQDGQLDMKLTVEYVGPATEPHQSLFPLTVHSKIVCEYCGSGDYRDEPLEIIDGNQTHPSCYFPLREYHPKFYYPDGTPIPMGWPQHPESVMPPESGMDNRAAEDNGIID